MTEFYKRRLFWWYWFPVIVYCVAIFVQSAYPSPDSLSSFPLGDKGLHLLGYAVMGGLFYRALAKTRPNWRAPGLVLFSIFLTTLYGMSDEVHQSFVAARMAEWGDVLADFTGGAVGALCLPIGCLLVRRKGDGV